LYDLTILGGGGPPLDPPAQAPSFASLEPARLAMGEARRFAEAVDLAHMQPRGDLSSTGYALANPGREYLVLRPDDLADEFTIAVSPGTYTTRWHNVASRETTATDPIHVGQADVMAVRSPFGPTIPAVLHLTSTGA
jgi:hypothetical protein